MPTGTDLTEITANAPDGHVITLEAGSYPGQINVAGKSLTVRGAGADVTRLESAETSVYIQNGGRLQLEAVHLAAVDRPVSDGLSTAIWVSDGELVLRDCLASGGGRAAVNAVDSSVLVENCRFQGLHAAMAIAGGAEAEIREATFEGIGLAGVIANDSARATIIDSRFVGIGEVAVSVGAAAFADIRGSQFEGPGRTAVVAAESSELSVHDSHFSGLETAIYLSGNETASVELARFEGVGTAVHLNGGGITLRDCEASGGEGPAVRAGGGWAVVENCRFRGFASMAIQAYRGARVEVDGASFDGPGRYGIVALEPQTVSVNESRFAGFESAAIYVQDGGTASVRNSIFDASLSAVQYYRGRGSLHVEGSRVTGFTEDAIAIYFDAQGEVAIRDNEVEGMLLHLAGQVDGVAEVVGNFASATTRAITIAVKDDPTRIAVRLEGNKLLTNTEHAVLLSGEFGAELVNNILLTQGDIAVFVQNGAVLLSSGNIVAGQKGAVYLHHSAGRGHQIDSDVLVGGVAPEEPVSMTQATRGIALVIDEADLRAKIADIFESQGEAREGAIEALRTAAASRRAEFENVASVRVVITDRFGTEFDGIVTVEHEEDVWFGNGLATGEPHIVMPGLIRIFSADVPRTVEVVVEPGEERIVTLEAPDHLALEFWDRIPTDQPVRTLLRLKSQAEMRQALASYRHFRTRLDGQLLNRAIAVRRPGITPERAEQVLTLVRWTFDQLLEDLHALGSEIVAIRIAENVEPHEGIMQEDDFLELTLALRDAVQLLTAVGEAEDVERILAASGSETFVFPGFGRQLALEYVMAAAWLENRIGRLDSGTVARWLYDDDRNRRAAAALAMTILGKAAGEETLIDHLASDGIAGDSPAAVTDRGIAGQAFGTLLASDDPQVLSVARWLVELHKRALQEDGFTHRRSGLGFKAALYLLAYGDLEDQRLAASLPQLTTTNHELLALLVDNPSAITHATTRHLARRIAEEGWPQRPDDRIRSGITDLCPAIREADPAVRDSARSWTLETLRAVVLPGYLGQAARSFGVVAARQMEDDLWRHQAVPDFHLASSYCAAHEDAARRTVSPGRDDPRHPWVLYAGRSTPLYLLPSERRARAIENQFSNDPRRRELALLLHEVATPAPLITPDYIPRGIDRQAIVFPREEDPSGGVSLVVSARAEFLEERLRLGISMDVAAYEVPAMLPIGPDVLRYRDFVATAGKALISDVTLRRGGERLSIEPAGIDGRGDFVFDPDPAIADLFDLHLDLHLDVFGTEAVLTFPLFAGELALGRGKALRTVETARSALAANPDSIAATARFADALREIGAFGEALELYIAALGRAAPSAAAPLRAELARHYAERQLVAQALSLLEAGLARGEDEPPVWLRLAQIRFDEGDYAGAAEAYTRLAELQPDQSHWLWWAMTAALLIGDADTAHGYFSTVEADPYPEQTAILHYLAAVQAGAQDLRAALARFDRLLAAVPEAERGWRWEAFLARVFRDGADRDRPSALENSAGACRRYVAYGISLLGGGEVERARQDLDTAARICPPRMFDRHLALHAAEYLRREAQ